MADNDINILQEIDESMRLERFQQLWRRFGNYIVAGSAAILLGTIAYAIYQHYADNRAEEATAQLIEADALVSVGRFSDASLQYKRIADKYGRLSGFATLKQAQSLLGAGSKDEAAKILAALTASGDAGELVWRDFAALEAAKVSAPDKAIGILRPVSEDGRPFAYSARQDLALLLMGAGQEKEARDLLKGLSQDREAPPTIRKRADKVLSVLGDAPDKK